MAKSILSTSEMSTRGRLPSSYLFTILLKILIMEPEKEVVNKTNTGQNSCVPHLQAPAHLLIRGLVSHDKNQTFTFSRKIYKLVLTLNSYHSNLEGVFEKRNSCFLTIWKCLYPVLLFRMQAQPRRRRRPGTAFPLQGLVLPRGETAGLLNSSSSDPICKC